MRSEKSKERKRNKKGKGAVGTRGDEEKRKEKRGAAKGFKGVQLALMDDGFEYECECGETDKRRERGNPKGGARRKGLRDKWTGLHTLTVESGEWRMDRGQGYSSIGCLFTYYAPLFFSIFFNGPCLALLLHLLNVFLYLLACLNPL